MTSYEDSRTEIEKQLAIPELLVADRSLPTVHKELTKIVKEKTDALESMRGKVATCISELEAQKQEAGKKAMNIADLERTLKETKKDLEATEHAITVKEEGELDYLNVELSNGKLAEERAKENVKVVIRLQDESSARIFVVVDGAFQLSQELLAIHNREELYQYGEGLAAMRRGARTLRALLSLWKENGMLKAKDWLDTFAIKPPDGFSKSEWNRRHPNPRDLVGMRSWDFVEALKHLGDIIGLPKGTAPSPSRLMKGLKRRNEIYEDNEDDRIATDPSTAASARKKVRLSAEVFSPELAKTDDLKQLVDLAQLELEKRETTEKTKKSV